MAPGISDRLSPEQLLSEILALGKAGDFEAVLQFARGCRNYAHPHDAEVFAFISHLSMEDLNALIKAIAKFEEVRGGGSVSMNRRILFYRPGGDNETLDWVLRNSHWHEGKGARSLKEYELICARDEQHAEEMEALDLERHVEAFRRKAQAASASICGAIRRKDAKAIAGLLRKGAGPDVRCPDGATVRSFVEASENEELRRILDELSAFEDLMQLLTEIGREGRFAEAVELGARCRNEQTSGVSILSEDATAAFRCPLSHKDFEARAKALAMFEMGYGWRGRQSFVSLLAYRRQGVNPVFDWVLRNTSGWHYAKGMNSLEAYESRLGCDSRGWHI